MTTNNYEITRDRMRLKFLDYNQPKMIEKYHLKSDEDYLYIDFMGRSYRIGRLTGKVEWSGDSFQTSAEAGFNESMTIYDILCYAKDDCHLSGRFCPVHSLKGTVHRSGDGLDLYSREAVKFQGKIRQLTSACDRFGEPCSMSGDVSYILYPFSFLPITLQYWEADEEFPASLKFMLDENIQDYMHYETIYYMVGHVLTRLLESMHD